MRNWYVVYTRPECEQKVAEALTRKNIENYCPVANILKKTISYRKEPPVRPVFSSYVFVRLKEEELGKLKSINRIINVVYWLSSPAIVRDIEVEMIKRFLQEHKSIQVERMDINPLDIVKVVRESVLEQAHNKESYKMKLLLPSLGYSLIGFVESEHIKVLPEELFNYASES